MLRHGKDRGIQWVLVLQRYWRGVLHQIQLFLPTADVQRGPGELPCTCWRMREELPNEACSRLDVEYETSTSSRTFLDHYAFPGSLLMGSLAFQTRAAEFRVDFLLLLDANVIG